MGLKFPKETVKRIGSEKKADRPDVAPPKAPPQTLHWIGEPKRVCSNCEHYDRCGRKPDGSPGFEDGPCHNGISGRRETKARSMACARGFYPCTIRFPLEERINAEGAAQ